MPPRILIVEDEEKLASLIRRGLREHGLAADVAGTGEDALWMAGATAYDSIVLDVMLPGIDGFDTCRRLRADGVWSPVLMLTARDAVTDRVDGLDAGADDYLTKPFALDELLARVRALHRRSSRRADMEADEAPLTFADLTLDPVTRDVTRAERKLSLTRTEFALLELFLRRPKRVLERSFILEEVWGFDFPTTANSLEVYVGYVRRKLEAEGEDRLLHTVRGVGYVLRETPP